VSGVCAVVSRGAEPVEDAAVSLLAAGAPRRATGGAVAHHDGAGAVLVQLRRARGPEPGAVPAVDPATGVVVVADARIDNREELRHGLGTDAPAAGAGTNALILAAYLRWNLSAMTRLVGDFAVVMWDPRRRRLVLARDPMGMRALCYRIEPDRVLVATEAAQLLRVPGVPDDPDERMAAAYLVGCFGSSWWSYHRGIEQVAPSHGVVIEGTSVRRWRHWDVDPDLEVRHRTRDGYVEELRALLLESVRARLVDAGSAGILLSGGVDSGAVAAAAGWLREQGAVSSRLHSYSWDYGSLRQCDERAVSNLLVAHYALSGRDIPAEDAGPLAGYPQHAPDVDDPFLGHFQTLLDRAFARAEHDHVETLFTGMRGDLAIGPVDEDYATLLRSGRALALLGEVRRQRAVTGETAAAVLGRHVLPEGLRLARAAVRRGVRSLVLHRRRGSDHDDRAASPPWIDPAFARHVGLEDLRAAYTRADAPPLAGPLRRRRYQWLFMPMQLRWATSHERRVASFGLQAADPWSDRRIAQWCVAVPQQVIDDPFATDKRLARDALRGIAPDGFLRAAGKTLPRPLYERTLAREARPAIVELLAGSRAGDAGWIDPGVLQAAYDRFLAGGQLHGEFWWAISLEWWLRAREGASSAALATVRP
jgi:asparagine synthase (glutamine-hydrolysing)